MKYLAFLFFNVFTLSCAAQVYNGDFTLRSQSEVDSAVNLLNDGGFSELSGTLWIGGQKFDTPKSIWDLSGLSILKKIGGLVIQSTDSLVDLSGLHNLEEIAGPNFLVRYNEELQTLEALNQAIFTEVALGTYSEVHIVDNPKLKSLDGLSGIHGVGFQLRIRENPLLENIQGLQNLEFVRDLFFINDSKITSLQGLEQFKGECKFSLSRNLSLEEISAMSGWENLQGFTMVDHPLVTDLSPISPIHFYEPGGSNQNIAAITIKGSPLITTLPSIQFANNIGGQINLLDLENLSDISSLSSIIGLSKIEITNCNDLTKFEMSNWTTWSAFGLAAAFIFESNSQLEEIVFPNIEKQVGRIIIGNNPALRNIVEADKFQISQRIEIFDNPALEMVTGFNSLDSISNRLFIANNNIKLLNGFSNLRVVGSETLTNNEIFITGRIDSLDCFHNLEEIINGRLVIAAQGFSYLPEFPKLIKVEHSIALASMDKIKSYVGFQNLKELGHGISILENDNLEFLNIGNKLNTIDNSFDNYITVYHNPSLKEFHGFNTPISGLTGSTEIQLIENSMLEKVPAICSIRENLGFWPNMELADNSIGFNNISDIEEHCDKLLSNELLYKPEVLIYPNPFVNNFKVRLSQSDGYDYKLFNSMGTLVKSGSIFNSKQLEVSNPISGLYLIQLFEKSGSLVYQSKIICVLE